MIKGLDNLVYLDELTHRYFHRETGDEYMSCSKFRSLFKEPFDKNIAYRIAGKGEYANMTPEEIIQGWDDYKDERADDGTRIHKAIELFFETGTTIEGDEKYRPALLNIASQYSHYYRTYNEVIVHDDEHKRAGTIDKPLVTTSHKDSIIDITDWKTNIKGVHQKDLDKHGKPINKYMKHCLSHLMDSKYNDYAIQVSDYAYMLEKQTGRRIGQLNIHYVNPTNPLINFKIPVPYMKMEIIEMNKYIENNAIVIEKPVTEVKQKSAINNWGNSEWDM